MYGIDQDTINVVSARRGRLHAYDAFEGPRTALVIVDMQNYFVAPGYAAEVAPARDIVPAINAAARAVRAAGGLVVWIHTSSDGADEYWSCVHHHLLNEAMSKRRLTELSEKHEGYKLWPALEAVASDLHVTKTRFSALIQGSSPLEGILRERGIDTVLIGGTATNVCCESTARDAMMLNFKTVMLADCNAASTEAAHVGTLANFIQFFGDVMNGDEMAQRLRPAAARAA